MAAEQLPLSDRERKVLEQFEQEFRPSATSPASRAPDRWSSVSVARRTAASAVALPAGLVFMILGLVLNDAAGIALAVVGYLLLVVVGFGIFLDGVPRARAALARRSSSRPASRPPGSVR